MSNASLKYAQNYVQMVTTTENAPAPDHEQAGIHGDTLDILYDNYKQGGIAGAVAGWNILKKIYKHLETNSKLINFHDLGSIPLPDYVLPVSAEGKAPNYAIYKKGLNLLYGAAGSGKSFLGIDVAARISLANPNNIVVYSAGEGIPGLEPRLKAWEKHNGATVRNLFLWKEALPFMNEAELARFVDEVSDKRPAFIIVDTLARAMVGMNENDTREAGLFIQAVEKVMERLSCGLMFIHHTNKLGLMRGSTVLDGAMDSILKLQKDEEQIVVYNSLDRGGKNKHREEAQPLHFRLLPVEVDGMKEATIVPGEMIVEDPTAPMTYNQKQIFDCISGTMGISSKIIGEFIDIKTSTLYYNLKAMKEKGLIVENNGLWSVAQS